MISFSDQECEIFTGKINRPLCDMLCAAPEFLHNVFNSFLKYFYAPMICKNVVLNRLLCYRRAKVKVEFMQESIYFEFQDRILLCQCYWVVCTHNKNIYLQKFSFKSKKKKLLYRSTFKPELDSMWYHDEKKRLLNLVFLYHYLIIS